MFEVFYQSNVGEISLSTARISSELALDVTVKESSLHEVGKTLMQNTDNKNFAFILSNLIFIFSCAIVRFLNRKTKRFNIKIEVAKNFLRNLY